MLSLYVYGARAKMHTSIDGPDGVYQSSSKRIDKFSVRTHKSWCCYLCERTGGLTESQVPHMLVRDSGTHGGKGGAQQT